MTDRAEVLELVREQLLDRLPVASSDPLAHQVRAIAVAVRAYAVATHEAMERGSLALSDAAWDSYSLALRLYAPGVIAMLAGAMIELEAEIARLRAHLAEQAKHLQTRIEDGNELGPTCWRLALEDAVRENRAVLAGEEAST